MMTAVALLAGGCFWQAESKYAGQLVPAAGRITIGGKPLADATVMFVPMEGVAGLIGATAFTDADGHFTAITPLPRMEARRSVGMIPGRYRVVLRKLAMPGGAPVPEGIDDSEALARGAINAVPERYRTAETTSLTVEIPGEGSEGLELELSR